MQESHSAKVLQMCFSLPCIAGGKAWVRPPLQPLPSRSLRRSLVQSKQLQPDYVSSHTYFTKSSSSSEIYFVPTAFHKYVLKYGIAVYVVVEKAFR